MIFAIGTGLSRIAGLIREVVAAGYFGTSGAASAFTLAFQIPNLIRALVADAALSSAFVPVFSELLENKKRREAYQLASALAGLLLVGLTLITIAFILLAPVLVPLVTGDEFTAALDALCVGLSQVLFPIVVLLGLTGLAVGILNVHDQFAIPAIAPLAWNLVIIAGIVGLAPLFEGDDRLYAYAIGVVAGTLVQLLIMLPSLRKIGFPVWRIRLPKRGDERVKRVLVLMVPVSVGLGLININLLLNSAIGSLVDDSAPRAIDAAFRVYMLPQGVFSVAVATVLFPQLARLAARGDYSGMQAVIGVGLRQIALLLLPAGAAMLVLADPIVQLVYERGEWTAESTRLTADALFWFAFSLPFSGFVLMLTRGFFSLQRPWVPTTLAVGSLAINAIGSYFLSKSFGIAGIVIGTALSNAALVIAEAIWLRHALGGFQTARTLKAMAQMLAGAAVLAGVAYGVWWGLDAALGSSLPAQIAAVGAALVAGSAAYAGVVLALRIPEARQILDLFASRLRRRS